MASEPEFARAQLPSAFRLPDGSPRFALSLPLASLADGERFAEFQAELVGGGLDPEIRTFFDDRLRAGDVVVDVGPGWGVHAFGAVTSKAPGIRAVCVTRNADEAELLAANARRNGLEEVVTVHRQEEPHEAPLRALLEPLLAEGNGRAFLRVAESAHLPGLLAQCAWLLEQGRLAAVVWACPRGPDGAILSGSDRIMLQGLGAFGFVAATVAFDEDGAVLVPFESDPGASLVFCLAPSLLEARGPGGAGSSSPAAEGWFGDRFVVFSGGGLAHGAGQDLVIAAFREFQERHPDALLLAAWDNLDPQSLRTIELAGIGAPDRNRFGELEVRRWLAEAGVPVEAVVELGPLPQERLREFLREADVALFPARCGEETRPVAEAALACGTPVLLTAGAGHRSLLPSGLCVPLRSGTPEAEHGRWEGAPDRDEVSVAEVVAGLERVYRQRGRA